MIELDRLQDGIYFRPGQQPAPSLRLLLLNVRPVVKAHEARDAIARLWQMLSALREGVVRDLLPAHPADPEVQVPASRLTCLLGFGARLFDPDAHTPRLVATDDRPLELVSLRPHGVGAPFRSLPWASEADRRPGEADLALQFIADTELAANRAVVETWKLIGDEGLPLDLVTVHNGFRREDQRSWIDFFDEVNNIELSQRQGAIEVAVADPPWLEGGTYMAFLRIAVDLAAWRRLSREHQEIIVGRDKLTGCPLERVERGPQGELSPVAISPCPISGTLPLPTDPTYMDPSRPGDPLIQASHIHRANRNRGGPDTDANNRVFRQGYEFLEMGATGQLQVGLNFISFQRSLSRLTQILRVNDWMGDVNFGGPAGPRDGQLESAAILSIIAGGWYAVPPKADPFPGVEVF